MSKLGVTMPGLTQPISAFPKMAAMAEDAGFDSVWDYEFYRNPFVIHGTTAQKTSRIPLGIGLATAEMAKQEGADVIVASRNVAKLDAVAEKLNAVAIPTDVTSDQSVVDLFRRATPA